MIHGRLYAYWETGTEGVFWAVLEDGADQAPDMGAWYRHLHLLEPGDTLTILDGDTVLWHGVIDPDRETNRMEVDPDRPGVGQQNVHGYWVHWVQRDVLPETWSSWFWGHESRPSVRAHPLRGTLERRPR